MDECSFASWHGERGRTSSLRVRKDRRPASSRDASAETASNNPRYGLLQQAQHNLWRPWEKGWKENMGIHLDEGDGKRCHNCSILWADNYWVMSPSEGHAQQMVGCSTEETKSWDVEPTLASLWLSNMR